MAVLDRLILRMAACELLRDPGTPPAVVINEALELARTFSTEDVGEVHQRHAGRDPEEDGSIARTRAERHAS